MGEKRLRRGGRGRERARGQGTTRKEVIDTKSLTPDTRANEEDGRCSD